MNKKLHINIFILATLVCLVAISLPAQAQTSASYLYHLSNFNGPVASLWARIAVDQQEGEIYTLNHSDSTIQIFSDTAMQTFGFGENLALAAAVDIAAGKDGEIYVLYRSPANTVRHLDYRGELLEDIVIDGRTGGLQSFSPDFVDYQAGNLYLADAKNMQVVVASTTGDIQQTYDFRALITAKVKAPAEGKELSPAQQLQLRDKLKALKDADFNGFSVDERGNIYFTVAPIFSAYRMSPQAELQAFGIAGGAPGKFGVVASIEADSKGNIFVSDRLRCVVLMFDRELNFLTEFGYRGSEPQNLVVPDDIAIDERSNMIYVAQAANLGVSVFRINND